MNCRDCPFLVNPVLPHILGQGYSLVHCKKEERDGYGNKQ
jgi:hypothetical protein